MTLPNFIVIGAAKAGTTALYWYLAEHPAVFMSPVKETNYFAYGLDDEGRLLYRHPDFHRYSIKTLRQYEALFAAAGHAKAIGEVSPIYLECPQSAGRIREQLPSAGLVCILRQPVDRAYSDYQMYLRSNGRRLDLARDLTADSDWARPDSHWMRIGKYHEQLSRYFERFPREQIHVLLFDDLKRAPGNAIQEVYRFLGVDSSFVPDFDTPHNIGGMPASRFLEGVFTSRAIRKSVGAWIPKGAANWVRRLRTRNLRPAPQLSAELRATLNRQFREDISRTSELIGRSLDHWL